MRYIFHNFISTLKRYRMSSSLNIIGMAVAFAAFYVIMTQVYYNLGYNKSLKDADRTFVITTPSNYNQDKVNAYICRPLAENIISGSSSVESGGVFSVSAAGDNSICWTRKDGQAKKMVLNARQFSAGGISTFDFQAEEGTLDELSKPGTIAVSAGCAAKYGLHIGDKISWSDPEGEKNANEIVAIYRDFPANSDLFSVNSVYDMGDVFIDDRSEWSYNYVVKLHDASDREAFMQDCSKQVREFVSKLFHPESDSDLDEIMEQFSVKLISFREIYYCSSLESYEGRSGSLTTDLTLLAVAVLTILIALINFVNFFFALVPARLRSVNTYKVFGVTRTSLVFNFIFESVGLVVTALALAAAIVAVFLHTSAAGILTSPAGFNLPVSAMTAGIALVAAVLGSIYPALYITSFQPALVLKGSSTGSAAGNGLRNALICVQFVISISLIVCAMFIKMQHSYMMNYEMGFDKSNLLSGDMPYGLCWFGQQNEAFESKLRSNPQILDITWADGELVRATRMGWGRSYKGQDINFQCYPVAYNFLKFMGIGIVEGRDFTKADELSESGTMIFNEHAQKEFDIDLETPAPGAVDNCVTAGICRDFNFKPLKYGNAAFAFYVFGKDHSWRRGLRHVYIRTAPGADVKGVIRFVLDTVKEMKPDAEPETYRLDFFDKELGRRYVEVQHLATLIDIFTVIAIIISLMGVFGLVLFDTQHRSREIAVRRVMGGSVGDIVRMFNVKYVIVVLASFVVALPVSLWVVHKYLAGFSYRTPVHWWVFAVALAVVLAVTVTVVTLRSLSAATSNPVDQLKNE